MPKAEASETKNKRSLHVTDFTFPTAHFLKSTNSLRSNMCFFTEISPGNVENPPLIRSLIMFSFFMLLSIYHSFCLIIVKTV